MRRRAIYILLPLWLAVWHSPAFAQNADVREINARGMKAFAEGDYVEAAELFGRAYALDPQGELLKNQAVAWYKAERCTEAVESSHQFLLRGQPTDAERAEAQSLIGACKVRLAREAVGAGSYDLAEKLLDDVSAMNPDPVLADRIALVRVEIAKRRAAATEEPERKNGLGIIPLDDIQGAEPTVAVSDPTPLAEPSVTVSESQPDSNAAKAWPLIGSGALLLAGAVTYHVVMAAVVEPNFREAARAGTDRARYDSLDRTLRTANILVPTLYGLGGAVTATGIYVMLKPAPGPAEEQSVMLGVSGRF